MPNKKIVTWILVADGERARVLKNEGPGKGIEQALDRDFENPATHGFARDLKSDKPGRAFDTGSGARHAMAPHHDYHVFQKQVFAREMAKILDEAAAKKSFERLVLVAPPKTLGDLRAGLDEKTRKLVTGELHKDLTHLSIHELGLHLKDILPV